MYYDKKPDFGLALFMIAFLFVTAIGVINYKQPKEVNAYYERTSNWQTESNNKVKVISARNLEGLEKQINEFIKDVIVLDIDFEYDIQSRTQAMALIHYREK